MDQIDQMLLGAWRGMNNRLRMDRVFGARREARAFRVGLLRRPARACCLALRSSDTRLVEEWNVDIDPPGAVANFDLHRVTISGSEIRDLVKPVYIPHREAMPASRACHLFGRSKEHMARWVKRGVFGVAYVKAMSQGVRGRPVPMIWTKSPMDPNANEAEPPDGVWGTAWQWLWKYVPEDIEQTLYRQPRFNRWRGQRVFRGWDWICPGRMVERSEVRDARDAVPFVRVYEMPSMEVLSGVHDVDTGRGVMRYAGCGQRVRRMYSPVRAMTLADYLYGMDDGDTDSESRAAIDLPAFDRAHRSFACRDCWQPVFTDGVNPNETWNLFVTHMSGGLMTGSDVPRPRGVAERGRKHVFVN